MKLDGRDHSSLARWAADCAWRVLPYFEGGHPGDDRPRRAIEAARARARGGGKGGEAPAPPPAPPPGPPPPRPPAASPAGAVAAAAPPAAPDDALAGERDLQYRRL